MKITPNSNRINLVPTIATGAIKNTNTKCIQSADDRDHQYITNESESFVVVGSFFRCLQHRWTHMPSRVHASLLFILNKNLIFYLAMTTSTCML